MAEFLARRAGEFPAKNVEEGFVDDGLVGASRGRAGVGGRF